MAKKRGRGSEKISAQNEQNHSMELKWGFAQNAKIIVAWKWQWCIPLQWRLQLGQHCLGIFILVNIILYIVRTTVVSHPNKYLNNFASVGSFTGSLATWLTGIIRFTRPENLPHRTWSFWDIFRLSAPAPCNSDFFFKHLLRINSGHSCRSFEANR